VNAREIARKQGVPETDVARMCWKCGQYGEEQGSKPAGNGNGKVTGYVCKTQGCNNYGTGWVVQITRDGTVPDRTAGFRNMKDTEFSKDSAARMNAIGAAHLQRIKDDAEESIKERES
jgi:hypothetical protein